MKSSVEEEPFTVEYVTVPWNIESRVIVDASFTDSFTCKP